MGTFIEGYRPTEGIDHANEVAKKKVENAATNRDQSNKEKRVEHQQQKKVSRNEINFTI